MSSGADLFVVCKQCGSEVSPYITECPYCGNRLRRRAPKLPRERDTQERKRGTRIPAPGLGRLRRGEIPGIRAEAHAYAALALVLGGCGMYVATRGGYVDWFKVAIIGPLNGEWWRLLSSPFAYLSNFSAELYAVAAIGAVGLFGWLLERRHGPLVVLALFFGSSVSGALAAEAVYPLPVVSGANAAALGLLAAWAAPDLDAARRHEHYDGDLLGTAAIAAILLAFPFALAAGEASWLAGVTGGLLGLLLGFGLARTERA